MKQPSIRGIPSRHSATAIFLVLAAHELAAGTDQPVSLRELQDRVSAVESAWDHCSVEVMRFAWLKDADAPDSKVVHHLQLDDRFREHTFTRTRDPQTRPELTIRQWDGKVYTKILPETEVDRRDNINPQRPTSQPYGVILEELGFSGTLTQFLTEQPLTQGWVAGIQVTLDEPGDHLLRVTRRARLPGASRSNVIELKLDKAHGLLPHSGIVYYLDESDGARSEEAALSVVHQKTTADSLHYSLYGNKPGQVEEDPATERVAIRVRAEQLPPSVAFDQLRVRELVGNPMVRTYHGDELATEERFRRIERPPPEGWSALEKWLLINDFFLVIAVVVIAGRALRSRLRRPSHASPTQG